MIVNTSRGALVDAAALIEGLKSGRVGYLELNVYEEEEQLFFRHHDRNFFTYGSVDARSAPRLPSK